MSSSKAPRITAEEFHQLAAEQLPFMDIFGIVAEEIGHGHAQLRLKTSDDVLRPGGTVSGPAMMGLADAAMYAVVLGMIGRVELAVTTSLNCNFLRRPKPADIIAKASILKLGRRLAVGEVTLLTEGDDDPVAHVTATYSIPPDRDE